MNQTVETLTINGETYYRGTAPPALSGKRAIIVVDRGWIFAGDVTEKNGRIVLTRAVWVFNWREIGLDGVIKDPKSPKAQLRKLATPVDMPSDAEIFRFPVGDSWGLE